MAKRIGDRLQAGLAPPVAASLKRYIMALVVVGLWGASFVLTKASLGLIGPMAIAFLRWAISAFFLVAWIAARGRLVLAAAMIRTDGLRVSWLALTGIAVYYALQNLALQYTTATNAGILSNMVTVFIVLIAVLWYGERLRPLQWLALLGALLGAVLVSQGSGHFSLSGPGLRGDVLMVVSSVFAALYSVHSRPLTSRYGAEVVTAAVALTGALLLLPLALAEGVNLALPPLAWGSLLLLGLGSGALANLWWLGLLAQMDASRAGTILLLIPVVSTFLAVTFLHEPLLPLAALGAVLVLAGVAVTQRKA